MKNRLLIFGFSLFSVLAFAQGKLKKEIIASPEHKYIVTYDKQTQQRLCTERWDTFPNNKILNHSYCNIYNDKNQLIRLEGKDFLYEKGLPQKLIAKLLIENKYDQFGNVENEEYRKMNLLDNSELRKKSTYSYLAKDLLLKSTEYLWDDESNQYYPTFEEVNEYNDKNCLTSRKNTQFYFASTNPLQIDFRYTYLDKDCDLEKYVRVHQNPNGKQDTTDIDSYTYKDNKKDVFARYYYHGIDCDYGTSDSAHWVKNDAGQKMFYEHWQYGTEYEKIEYVYTPSGKIAAQKTKYIDTIGEHFSVIFSHYDEKDSLILVESYLAPNNVIDSLTRNVIEESTYTYDNDNHLLKVETEYGLDEKNILTYKYNCSGLLIEEEQNSNAYLSKVFYEYYDDICEENSLGENKLLLYPNPVQETLNVKQNENQKIKQLNLCNAQGQLLRTYLIEKCDIDVVIDVSFLEKGTYFLKSVFDNGESGVKGFVKVN